MRLLLDERIASDGARVRTFAASGETTFELFEDERPLGRLPIVALERVMVRYGRPLEPGVQVEPESIAVGPAALRRLRFHAIVDAEARDYLVYERPGEEPLAALATTATAALRHLVRSQIPEGSR